MERSQEIFEEIQKLEADAKILQWEHAFGLDRALPADLAQTLPRTDCGCDPDEPWTWLWSGTGHDP